MADETIAHNIELAIEADIEKLLHPAGATGPDAPSASVPAVPSASGPSGSVPAAAAPVMASAPPLGAPAGVTAPTGATGTSGPTPAQGVTGPFHILSAYEATGSSGPYFVLAKDPNAPPSRFGVDSEGHERVPPPEPTSSGGTGAQTGSQHQIFDKR